MTPTPDEVAALLPCPFCGGSNIHYRKYIAYEQSEAIWCETCEAEVTPEMWNRRASLSPPAGMVMVPREPTREMIESALTLLRIGEVADVDAIYRVMLSARERKG